LISSCASLSRADQAPPFPSSSRYFFRLRSRMQSFFIFSLTIEVPLSAVFIEGKPIRRPDMVPLIPRRFVLLVPLENPALLFLFPMAFPFPHPFLGFFELLRCFFLTPPSLQTAKTPFPSSVCGVLFCVFPPKEWGCTADIPLSFPDSLFHNGVTCRLQTLSFLQLRSLGDLFFPFDSSGVAFGNACLTFFLLSCPSTGPSFSRSAA